MLFGVVYGTKRSRQKRVILAARKSNDSSCYFFVAVPVITVVQLVPSFDMSYCMV